MLFPLNLLPQKKNVPILEKLWAYNALNKCQLLLPLFHTGWMLRRWWLPQHVAAVGHLNFLRRNSNYHAKTQITLEKGSPQKLLHLVAVFVTLTAAHTSQTWWLQIPFFVIKQWSQVNPSTAHCWVLLYRLHRTALPSASLSSCPDCPWSHHINDSWSGAGWGAEEEMKNRHRNIEQAQGGDQEERQEIVWPQGDLFNQRLKPGPHTGQ